jgi:hypothetical protein
MPQLGVDKTKDLCILIFMERLQPQQGGIKAEGGTSRTLDSTGTICTVPTLKDLRY